MGANASMTTQTKISRNAYDLQDTVTNLFENPILNYLDKNNKKKYKKIYNKLSTSITCYFPITIFNYTATIINNYRSKIKIINQNNTITNSRKEDILCNKLKLLDYEFNFIVNNYNIKSRGYDFNIFDNEHYILLAVNLGKDNIVLFNFDLTVLSPNNIANPQDINLLNSNVDYIFFIINIIVQPFVNKINN